MNNEYLEIIDGLKYIKQSYGLEKFKSKQYLNNCLLDLFPKDNLSRRIINRISDYGIFNEIINSKDQDPEGKKYTREACIRILVEDDGMNDELAKQYIDIISQVIWDNESSNTMNNAVDANDKSASIDYYHEETAEELLNTINRIIQYENPCYDLSRFKSFIIQAKHDLEEEILRNDPNTLFDKLLGQAEKGDACSMLCLARYYDEGYPAWNIDVDKRKSFVWLKRAAEKGSAEAQFEFACLLFGGEGIQVGHKLLEECILCLCRDSVIQFYGMIEKIKSANVGYRNYQNALASFNKAYENSLNDKNELCEYIGLMMYGGLGTYKNEKEALEWFEKSNSIRSTEIINKIESQNESY